MIKLWTLFAALIAAVWGDWHDDFSDGDFLSNPVWIGNTDKFTIDADGIRLNDAAAGTAYLTTTSDIAENAEWQFAFKLTFNPSSGNYAKVYLMADNTELTGAVNGYFVRIGHTADNICLIRQDGYEETTLITGRSKLLDASSNEGRVRVSRKGDGRWQLSVSMAGETDFTDEGTAEDAHRLSSAYFGIVCIYTKTNCNRFYFGKFEAEGDSYRPRVAKPYEVVINEVMANPAPSVHLPEYEYIELFNRSDTIIDLQDWLFTYGTTTKKLPAYELAAGEYLLLAHPAAEQALGAYGTVLSVLGSQTSISNDGQYLMLQNDKGDVISWLDFDDNWYADPLKSEGGWSLEQIDPEQRCSGSFNWKASSDDKGGTPGARNSVWAAGTDLAAPQIQRIAVPDEHSIRLYASKQLSDAAMPTVTLSPPVSVGDISVTGSHFNVFAIALQEALQPDRQYELTADGSMTDCAGYAVPAASFTFSMPQYADSLDVIINEILFNPATDGGTFIEFYNRSQKSIPLNDLQLAMRDDEGALSTPVALTAEPMLLLPDEYLVVSRHTDAVMQHYNAQCAACFIQMPEMPLLTKESGRIVLLNKSLRTIDEVHYDSREHSDFLNNPAGVSLERLNPSRPSLDAGSWHTASQLAGFATPGARNSQFMETPVGAAGEVTLSPEVFSPDNDGRDDVLNIAYHFDIPSLIGEVCVFDAAGRRIRRLAHQQILGTEGVISWDGTDESLHRKALTGIYVVYFNVYNESGYQAVFKLPCVVAARRQ